MTSWKKVLSNRLNAQKSSGPRTQEGKAVSSRNALKHALYARLEALPGEDQAEFRLLLDEFERDWQPVGFQEQQLVEAIALCTLQVRRGLEVEFQLFASGARGCDVEEPLKLAMAFQNASTMLDRITRQTTTAERRRSRAIDRLVALQRGRGAHEGGGEPGHVALDARAIETTRSHDAAEPQPDEIPSLFGPEAEGETPPIETSRAGAITVRDYAFAGTKSTEVGEGESLATGDSM